MTPSHHKKNCQLIIVWPCICNCEEIAALSQKLKERNIIIKDIQSYTLPFIPFCRLLAYFYQQESWCKAGKIPGLATIKKSLLCYGRGKNKPIYAILIKEIPFPALLAFKTKYREQMKHGKNSIHTFDFPEEADSVWRALPKKTALFSKTRFTLPEKLLFQLKLLLARLILSAAFISKRP